MLCNAALAEDSQSQLVVHAERPFVTVSKRQDNNSLPLTQYEVQYRVSYADLDLSKNADANTLRERVREAALSACKDIDEVGHFKEPDAGCAQRAESRSHEQVDAAIAGSRPTLYAEPEPKEGEVVVQAERMSAKVVTGPNVAIPITQYALGYRVSYADLNLATESGADVLKKRVHDAAESACKEIDRLNRFPQSDPACAHKAEAGAKPEVEAAIAAAQDKA
jgi:UrcA family protein